MRADVFCAFCASSDMHALSRVGDRTLVHCNRCTARVWLPAILVDYRKRRGQLLASLNWMRWKVLVEGGRPVGSRWKPALERYRLELADLRARLREVQHLDYHREEAA